MNIDLTHEEMVRIIVLCHDGIDINRQALRSGMSLDDETETVRDIRVLTNLSEKIRQVKES